MRRVELADAARADLRGILGTSERLHGERAADRYQNLIELAFADLQDDPRRPFVTRWRRSDIHLYPLRAASRRLTGRNIVRAPPHIVVFTFDEDVVSVVRLLHEAMNLPRRLDALI